MNHPIALMKESVSKVQDTCLKECFYHNEMKSLKCIFITILDLCEGITFTFIQ